ncbi:hypothetical protein AN958_03160, partial [Leucoagaricus sp. SymC.cos]
PPPLKRHRLEVPYREAHQKKKEEHQKLLQQALLDIEKLIRSKQTEFHAGREGLQACCACAIHAYLHMVVNNGQSGMNASARAAEAQRFLAKWGSHLIRQWVHHWLKEHSLPGSQRGHHIKSFSLLEDPVVQAELQSYIRSNKWAINPEKLANFSQEKMIPTAAKKYLDNILNHEIPKGLIDYFESEIVSRTQQKVVGKISLRTDEMTAQANDGMKYGWYENGEQLLKKKGAGRGIHQSDVICATVGWMKDASETLEYGKAHEGYWNGELFVKQYFWACVKWYLREHCDYTFTTLKENMPNALASVSVTLIRKWQNRMFRWVDAYHSGLDAQEAQLHVRAFSSRRYKSHRRIPDAVANALD